MKKSALLLFGLIGFITFNTYADVLPDGIIAWWKFDETTDTIAHDEAGLSNGALVNTGDSLWSKGVVGNALDLSRGEISAAVEVADNNTIDFDSTTSFSVSVLVKIDDISSGTDLNICFKGATGRTTPDEKGRWYGLTFKNNELRFVVDDDINKSQLAFVNANQTMKMGNWNHIVGVRNIAKDTMYIYLNGELVASMPDITNNDIKSSPLPLIIGNNATHNRNFPGLIDELRMYNKALSASEIKDLYKQYNLNPPPEGLVAYWKLDEGTGTDVKDEFETTNGVLINSTQANWIDGFAGKAIDFTTKNSPDTAVFIEMPGDSVADFDSTESFSLSVILKANVTDGSEQTIISKGMVGISNGGWYHLSYKNGAARFMVWDSLKLSSPEGVLPSNFPTNDWVHIVCVRNIETDSLEIYINGDLLDKCLDETNNNIANDGKLFIGVAPNWPQNQLRGAVDEIQIYNKALSPSEIRALADGYGFNRLILNNDATLSDLKVNGTAVEGFSPSKKTYSMVLPGGTTIVTVDAVTTGNNATVTGDGVINVTSGTGTATIKVTAENPAYTNTYTINFTVLSAINQDPADQFNIYPNPVEKNLYINHCTDIRRVEIYNITGVLVTSFENAGKETIEIPVATLPSGKYILRLVNVNNKISSSTIIKE